VQTFMVPALRKLREERGTRFVGDADEIKGRATRPISSLGGIEVKRGLDRNFP
jgi:hypothetical protein